MMTLYANGTTDQTLYTHSRAVAHVATTLAAHLGASKPVQDCTRIAGLIHDIGKAIPAAQEMFALVRSNSKAVAAALIEAPDVEQQERNKVLNPEREDAGPYHNEIAWAFLHTLPPEILSRIASWYDSASGIGPVRQRLPTIVFPAVLWSHACRRNVSRTPISKTEHTAMLVALNELVLGYRQDQLVEMQPSEQTHISYNAMYYDPSNYSGMLVRACLITADRAVAKLSEAECLAVLQIDDTSRVLELVGLDNGNIQEQVPAYTAVRELMPQDRRSQDQLACAEAEGTIVQVNAPTGMGKTRIGLLRTLYRRRRTLWVCPRNAVAVAVYHNVLSEIKELGLEQLSVELYLTGSRIACTENAPLVPLTSDIVITNVDMLLQPQTSYNVSSRMYSMFACDIVFDEHHEFVKPDSALLSMWLSFFKARASLVNGASIMCLSATPTNILDMLETADGGPVRYLPGKNRHYPAAHDLPYHLFLHPSTDTGPAIPAGAAGSLTMHLAVSNVRKHYQDSTKDKASNTRILHSKYDDTDKNERLLQVMTEFGPQGSGRSEGIIVSSGPIMQAGINTSFTSTHLSSGGAESDLQAARTNRFGEAGYGEIHIYDMTGNTRENAALRTLWSADLQQLWFRFMCRRFLPEADSNGMITIKNLNVLYDAYNDFYRDNAADILQVFAQWERNGRVLVDKLAPDRPGRARKPGTAKKAGPASLRSPEGSGYYVLVPLRKRETEFKIVLLSRHEFSNLDLRNEPANAKDMQSRVRAAAEFLKQDPDWDPKRFQSFYRGGVARTAGRMWLTKYEDCPWITTKLMYDTDLGYMTKRDTVDADTEDVEL